MSVIGKLRELWPWKREVSAKGVDRGSALKESDQGRIEIDTTMLSRWAKNGKPHPSYINQVGELYNSLGIYTRVNNIVLNVVGPGYYTTVEEKYPDDSKNPKIAVDKMAEVVGLDQKLMNVVGNMIVYGFAPVEPVITSGKGITKLKILPPPSVKYRPSSTGKGRVLGYIQGRGKKAVRWKLNELAWFSQSLVSTDLYGISLLAPLIDIQAIEDDAIKDMGKIIKKYWKLQILWKVGNTTQAEQLKKELEKLSADMDPIISGATKGAVEHEVMKLDPRIRFWQFIEWIDDMKSDELQSPSLSKFKSATEASAKKMEDIVDRGDAGTQRYVKRMVEVEFFKRHLDALNFPYTEVPRLNWGMQKTGVEELDISAVAALSNQATGPVLTPKMARDLLRKIGLPIEEEEA